MLHDLNSDHDRRHLDYGLSEELEFLLKRKLGDIKISLRENKRLNHNAAMHELVRESNGKTKMIKRKHIPLMVSTICLFDVSTVGTNCPEKHTWFHILNLYLG